MLTENEVMDAPRRRGPVDADPHRVSDEWSVPGNMDLPSSMSARRKDQGGFGGFLARLLPFIVLAVLGSGTLAAWLIVAEPPLERAEIIVFVGGGSMIHRMDDGSLVQDHAPGLRQVQYLAGSSAMFDHLIDQFALQEHTSTTERPSPSLDQLHLRLADRIQVTLLDRNALRVVVMDEDAERAAAMANEVFSELQVMTERDRRGRLQRAVQVHEMSASRAEARMKEQLEKIEEVLSDLGGDDAGSDQLDPERQKLNASLQEVASLGRGLYRSAEQQAIASVLMDMDAHTELVLVRKAIPSHKDLKLAAVVLWVPVSMLITSLLILALSALWWTKRRMLRAEWRAFVVGEW